MSQKFFTACLLFFGAILLLAFAIELLAKIWIWLALIALLVAAGWIGFKVRQNKRNPWK